MNGLDEYHRAMRSAAASISSSGNSTQDGPFPYLPPPALVRANFERQAALSSSSGSMPSQQQVDAYSAYPHNTQNSNSGIPDYPNPPWMDDIQSHGMYHNRRGVSTVQSDYDLPVDARQLHGTGRAPAVTFLQPEPSTKDKKESKGGLSKLKSLLNKLPGRRSCEPTKAISSNDTELRHEPFPEFCSVGSRTFTNNNTYQPVSDGAKVAGAKTKTSGKAQRFRRASWSSSGRRIPRRSMFSTMKSRISAFFAKKPNNRGRTWEPSPRRSSNPFSPFTRRNAWDRTGSAETTSNQPPVTGTSMF